MKQFHCFVAVLAMMAAPWCARAADDNAWCRKNWKGDIVLATGSYRGLDKGVVVQKDCSIIVRPGTLMDRGSFNCEAVSRWRVERSLFRKVKLNGGLGTRFDANDSVFEDCGFCKRSAWYVAYWGTRWNFENCVFSKRFMVHPLSVGAYSIRAINCTFYDLAVPKITYKDDPSK
jgi:hypothetical protein